MAELDRTFVEGHAASMTSPALFTLGTRGSPLALMQANEARRRLAEAHGWEIERIALKVIRTSGDTIQDRPLAEAGGKGLFTREIDAALLARAIDAAAHSAKDLPSIMPDGVVIAAYLPREDVRDALISALADTIEGLPHGATFGAASLRRQAQALRLRPDLKPALLRGNVETRLRKSEGGGSARRGGGGGGGGAAGLCSLCVFFFFFFLSASPIAPARCSTSKSSCL